MNKTKPNYVHTYRQKLDRVGNGDETEISGNKAKAKGFS